MFYFTNQDSNLQIEGKKIEKLKNYLDLSNLPDLLFWPKELSIFDKKNIKPFCCITTCDKAVTFEYVTDNWQQCTWKGTGL